MCRVKSCWGNCDFIFFCASVAICSRDGAGIGSALQPVFIAAWGEERPPELSERSPIGGWLQTLREVFAFALSCLCK